MPPAAETKRTVKYIFIASPGDLSAERKLFPKILEKINTIRAHRMGLQLEGLGWEDTPPGLGRPQALINADVEKCDLFVMLLWKRWGTPPAENSPYTSGTEEEFELARRLYNERGRPDIFLYFRQVPEEMLADPGPQLSELLKFRKKIEAERKLFFKRYKDANEWEELLMQHIARWLDGIQPVPSPSSAPIEPEVEKRISELEEQLRRLSEEHKDAQTKLRESALAWGAQAVAAAENGRLTEAEELFARATQAYPEPWVINAFGLYYHQIGSLGRAEEKFRQVEQIGKQEKKADYLAVAYGNLGLICRTRGNLHTAEEMQRKALALHEELGHKEGMASQYGNLANIYQTRGDLHTAEEMLRKALALHEELNHKEGMANDYGNLGLIYQTRGDLDTAEKMHGKALALDEELGRKEGMANQYGNLGFIYQTRGDLDTAEKMHRKALALHEQLGHKQGMANAYGNLGLIYQSRGDLDTAEKIYLKALSLNEELGCKEGMANQNGNLGNIYLLRGDLDTAEEMLRKALALHEELGRKEGMAIAYANLGFIYQTRGDLDTGEKRLRKALALFKQVGAKPEVEKTARLIAELRPKTGKASKGRKRTRKRKR